jgi:hypothetical protein
MATTAKRKERVAEVEKMMKGVEFTLNPDNYRSDLLKALNYYNANHDDKEKKKWFISYIARTDKKLATLMLKLDEWDFRHAGVLARLTDGGSILEEKEETYFKDRIKELTTKAKSLVEVVAVAAATKAVPVVSIQERMEEKAREIAGEFEGMIDEFVVNDKTFEAKDVLKQFQVSGGVSKILSPMFDKTIAELEEAIEGEDPQLVEGYSNFKKTKLKKLLALYKSIGEACGLQVQVAKATRAPRKRKAQPAGVVVSKMKYKKNDTEYSIMSVPPTSLVNSQELWVFNTKYKKLQVYRASGSSGLSVKGTTLVGWDPENSAGRTLRKPELVASYQAMGKRPLTAAYKALTTKEQAVNGRINEECVLLKVF